MSAGNQIIAVPSASDAGLDAQVMPRFGRCPFFTIVKMDGENVNEVTILENGGINAMGGAGPLAAQVIASEGVTTVLGGNYGPNAAAALTQGNIRCFGYPMGSQNVTVKQIIDMYLKGQLPDIQGANVGSHFGMGGGGGGTGSGQGMGGGRGMGGGGGMGGGRRQF